MITKPEFTTNFDVVLAAAPGRQATVDYKTVAGSGVEGVDYNPVQGTLVFAADETRGVVAVATRDVYQGSGVTFRLVLSNPVNCALQTDVVGDAALPGAPPLVTRAAITGCLFLDYNRETVSVGVGNRIYAPGGPVTVQATLNQTLRQNQEVVLYIQHPGDASLHYVATAASLTGTTVQIADPAYPTVDTPLSVALNLNAIFRYQVVVRNALRLGMPDEIVSKSDVAEFVIVADNPSEGLNSILTNRSVTTLFYEGEGHPQTDEPSGLEWAVDAQQMVSVNTNGTTPVEHYIGQFAQSQSATTVWRAGTPIELQPGIYLHFAYYTVAGQNEGTAIFTNLSTMTFTGELDPATSDSFWAWWDALVPFNFELLGENDAVVFSSVVSDTRATNPPGPDADPGVTLGSFPWSESDLTYVRKVRLTPA